jgi:NTP pyrophosphatase (non-canonical NTP hydrolase)
MKALIFSTSSAELAGEVGHALLHEGALEDEVGQVLDVRDGT